MLIPMRSLKLVVAALIGWLLALHNRYQQFVSVNLLFDLLLSMPFLFSPKVKTTFY
jgi:hypothetical protein